MENKPLKDKVALVAGGTRGAGRGIAVALGEAGATVYVTGRTTAMTASPMGRSETIEETAARVDKSGGIGIPVRVDHQVTLEVEALMKRIDRDHGRLDILVNDIWGGERLTHWGKPFWTTPLHDGLAMQHGVIDTHYKTAHLAMPLLLRSDSGLIAEITDGVDYKYRGNLPYSLSKAWGIHMAAGLAEELKPYGICAVSLTPGFLRSEEMLAHFGVTEASWRDAGKQDPHFLQSETPLYVGRALSCLAADPDKASLTGRHLSSWELSERYDFLDEDGSRPHWGRYYEQLERV